MRRLHVEDALTVRLGEDEGAARVDEQRRVPGRQEPHGCGRLGVGQRCAREVEELVAGLVAEAAQLHPLEHGREPLRRELRPAGDVLRLRRPEGAEVAAHQMFDPFVLGGHQRADPLLREAVRVCAALLPGAARGHANEVDPVPDGVRAERIELLARDRPAAQLPSQLASGRCDLAIVLELVDAQPPLLAGPADPRGQERIVAPRDEMDRLAHQRSLDHAPPLQGAREIPPLEPLDGRPQPDVAVRRVLILNPADPFEHPRDRQPHALEEQLPGEQRPVQLSRREDALGHGRRPYRTTYFTVLVLTTCRSGLYDAEHHDLALGEALTTWPYG